jgi:putative hydrolase of the HAD superfamily
VLSQHKLGLRGVLFDLDDTLADSAAAEERVWTDVAEVIAARLPGVERGELRRRYLDALRRHHPDFAAGRVDALTFRRVRLADAIEPWGALDDGLFEAYLTEKRRIPDEVAPLPEAIATVRALRARGIRVGVLTNGPSAHQRRKLEVSRLGPELDAIAISDELGVGKPDPQAFALALALLGTRAEETAMVGDSLANDVLGGMGAGLAAVVWVPGRRQGDLPEGAHLARELAEVPRLLGLG